MKIRYNKRDIALNGYLICTYGAVALISVWPMNKHIHKKRMSQSIISIIIFILLLFCLTNLRFPRKG